jgi:integrase
MSQKTIAKDIISIPGRKFYYFRAEIRGKVYNQSLKTRDLKLAKKRAKLKREAIEGERWEALEASRAKRSFATVGECVAAFRRLARMRGTRPSTVTSYVAKLRRFCESSFEGDWEKVSTGLLTPQAANLFIQRRLEAEDCADEEARQAIVNGAQSQLRNCSAIFGRDACLYYREEGLKLPEGLRDFGPAARFKAVPKVYKLPPADLIRATVEGGYALPDPLRWVFIAAFDLALRGDEIAQLTQDCFHQDMHGQWWLMPNFRQKGGSSKVRVPTALYEEIKTAFAERETYLPGATKPARIELVQRGAFTEWMRGLGWTTGHLAHELRALRGCWLYYHSQPITREVDGQKVRIEINGPLEAKATLGHSSITTTERSYAGQVGIPLELHPLFRHWDGGTTQQQQHEQKASEG